MKQLTTKEIGVIGEDIAVRFLRRKGYSILARNYATKIGELDIIAAKGRCIAFIEVKTRTSNWAGEPYEAVDAKKQRKLRALIDSFLMFGGAGQIGRAYPDVRADIISIVLTKSGTVRYIEHIRDAFSQ
jgi:putative endonuclease